MFIVKWERMKAHAKRRQHTISLSNYYLLATFACSFNQSTFKTKENHACIAKRYHYFSSFKWKFQQNLMTILHSIKIEGRQWFFSPLSHSLSPSKSALTWKFTLIDSLSRLTQNDVLETSTKSFSNWSNCRYVGVFSFRSFSRTSSNSPWLIDRNFPLIFCNEFNLTLNNFEGFEELWLLCGRLLLLILILNCSLSVRSIVKFISISTNVCLFAAQIMLNCSAISLAWKLSLFQIQILNSSKIHRISFKCLFLFSLKCSKIFHFEYDNMQFASRFKPNFINVCLILESISK